MVVALYVPIYDTSNSLLTESMVYRDMLLGKELGPLNMCSHVATLTREKRENLGSVIRENIIAIILFTCCSAKISHHGIFRVYGIRISTEFKI